MTIRASILVILGALVIARGASANSQNPATQDKKEDTKDTVADASKDAAKGAAKKAVAHARVAGEVDGT